MIRQGSPFVGLSLLLGYLAFELTWAEVVRCTRPTDIDALIKWGRAFHKAHNWPDDVAIPNDVRAAWHQAWRN
jgi:hypothetical protein